MSGGAVDSAVLCIAHLEPARETIVIDVLREIRSPHSPEAACSEFAKILQSYHLSDCIGDRYAASWPVEQFSRYGVLYRPEAEAKSTLYASLLASINSRRVDLLDNQRLVTQLVGLERRTGRTRDQIDHAPGQHDDVANAVAGAVATILAKGTYNMASLADTAPDDPHGIEGWRRMRQAAYLYSGGRIIM